MAKKLTIEQVLHFMDVQYGNNITVISVLYVGDDVKVLWREVGDEDINFSVVGYGKYGFLTEKIGG